MAIYPTLRAAVPDRLDVVAVGVAYEGTEVTRVVFRPEPWRMQRLGAEADGRIVEGAHLVLTGGLERDMDSRLGPRPVPSAIQNAG
ncbi:hypothetical protein A9W94_22250 [Mycobacterium asiaticum]|nr:hypothetical protein A9W94_22250 [Mycobacterium asiaticum]